MKKGVVIIVAPTLPQNIYILYAESEKGKETVHWGEKLQSVILQISDLSFFSFLCPDHPQAF